MPIFIGGPCDGQTAPSDVYAQRVCGDVTYTIHEDGNYHAPGDAGGPIGPEALGTRGPRGWADLQRAVNVSIPTGTSRAKVLTRAAHRKLVQRRRMR